MYNLLYTASFGPVHMTFTSYFIIMQFGDVNPDNIKSSICKAIVRFCQCNYCCHDESDYECCGSCLFGEADIIISTKLQTNRSDTASTVTTSKSPRTDIEIRVKSVAPIQTNSAPISTMTTDSTTNTTTTGTNTLEIITVHSNENNHLSVIEPVESGRNHNQHPSKRLSLMTLNLMNVKSESGNSPITPI